MGKKTVILQAESAHLNSTRPSFMPRIAVATSVTMVPSFAFGIRPRGPSTCMMRTRLCRLAFVAYALPTQCRSSLRKDCILCWC